MRNGKIGKRMALASALVLFSVVILSGLVAGSQVTFFVTDEEGNDFEGAIIEVYKLPASLLDGRYGDLVETQETGVNGTAVFDLDEGDYIVLIKESTTIYENTYRTERLDITVAGNTTFEVSLVKSSLTEVGEVTGAEGSNAWMIGLIAIVAVIVVAVIILVLAIRYGQEQGWF